ncbi:hypothetical protein KZ294_26595, partial [Escherichia coli]|nr:hypothetical protein [Escherichia coli]
VQALNAWDLHQPDTWPPAGYLQDPQRPRARGMRPAEPVTETVGQLARRMQAEGLDQRGA